MTPKHFFSLCRREWQNFLLFPLLMIALWLLWQATADRTKTKLPMPAAENPALLGTAEIALISPITPELPAASAWQSPLKTPPALPFHPVSTALFPEEGTWQIAIPSSSSVQKTLQEANEALKKGQWVMAEKSYLQILQRFPKQRESLIQLTLLLRHQGKMEAASRYQALAEKHYPDDMAVRLLKISAGEHTENTAALLEARLLNTDPTDAKAADFFALGNLYAAKGQWKMAQEAYFSAVAADSQNPDYAFNLAISLEQLGEGSAALNYYRLAENLAKTNAGTFDSAELLARIQQLSH